MEVIVNEQTKEVGDNISTDELLHELGWDTKQGIAVAVNNEVVPRDNWQQKRLSENDKVTIIQATQGG